MLECVKNDTFCEECGDTGVVRAYDASGAYAGLRDCPCVFGPSPEELHWYLTEYDDMPPEVDPDHWWRYTMGHQ